MSAEPLASVRPEAPVFCSSAILGLAALAHAAGVELAPEPLHRRYGLGLSEPSANLLVRIAEENGFKAVAHRTDWPGLSKLSALCPLLAQMKDESWVVIAGLSLADQKDCLAVLDPRASTARVEPLPRETFLAQWSGHAVVARRRYAATDERQPFGLLWFGVEILRQSGAFRDVAAASVILSFLALGTPLFTQLVIDKVLMHENMSTLVVLTVGIVFVMLFEAAFGFLRQFVLLGATNKIDMRLTRMAFGHLLSLPIQYFESRSAGVTLRNIYQLEGIRGFFTGQLLSTALDCVGLLIFAPLLFFYSPTLAALVLVFTFLMAVVVIALIKPFKVRLEAMWNAEAKRQSLMVEAIHGMRTVKALALEPSKLREWNERSAQAIVANFGVMKISITAGTITQILERSQSIVVIALGATLIFDHQMSVGSLIAFQMISGRVTGPLVAIVGLVHQYQQVLMSIDLLGQIMNHPPEGKAVGSGLRPAIRGGITLEEVSFRYPGSASTALSEVSFQIKPGQVVGVVGRSGSGKTTLTRLIQAMYHVQEGVVRIDGVDIREVELGYLRSSIGVVLQDNFMFRGTVRDNIAASKPNAPLHEVVAAAQAAGADEFIERLPQGYDSFLEENASNLSGGQRQRLAIARAILPQPKLLILDEAASALDPESEAIFIRNLSRIARGKTVLMVSHRLSTLVRCNAIMVFERGRVADLGTHEQLLARCAPYQALWRQQQGQVEWA